MSTSTEIVDVALNTLGDALKADKLGKKGDTEKKLEATALYTKAVRYFTAAVEHPKTKPAVKEAVVRPPRRPLALALRSRICRCAAAETSRPLCRRPRSPK